MEQDKPNQTDPNVSSTSPDVQAAISERLDAAIKQQKEAIQADNNMKPGASKETSGGSDSDVSSQNNSSATNPDAEVLKFVEASLGRKFSSIEDAKKTITNLNSLVGDQEIAKTRSAAKLYDTFIEKFAGEKGMEVEEAKKFWADTLTEKVVQPVKVQPSGPSVSQSNKDKDFEELSARVEKIDEVTQRSVLLARYPFASEVQDEIAILAKQKGITQVEAFENSPLKSLLEKKAEEESKKSPVVTPSNRSSFDTRKVQELGRRVIERGNEDDKVALVKEVLGDLVK